MNNFTNNLKRNIIVVLSKKKLLSPKVKSLFNEIEKFLKHDENNIFILFDILTYAYINNDTLFKGLNVKSVPDVLLTFIKEALDYIKSNLKQEDCKVKKMIVKYAIIKTQELFICVFNSYHGVNIKPNTKEDPLVLLLVENFYRHYFVKLPNIDKNSVLDCLKEKKLYSKIPKQILPQVINCAASISKSL